MRRFALDYLQEWKTKPSRKPLVVRGARQVGKSHLVRMFASDVFHNILEINLEIDREAPSLFASKEPATILPLLEARYGTAVEPGGTLLFLDEIQAAPQLLSCLRYFHEKKPELHVIAAGSLLDFALADHQFSMPVGRIEYAHLGPMSFEEFLLAAGKGSLMDLVRRFAPTDEVPEAIHVELMRLVRQYLVIGGMPASVEAFIQTGSYRESEAVRQGILSTCRDDFAKYAKHVDHKRLERVFGKIPLLVGTKFMYSSVDREERSRDLGRALELLCMARIAHRVPHTDANGVPLGAEADDRNFKVLFMDVGLLCRSCGLSVLDVEGAEDLMMVNAGAVCEQFVGQHLHQAGEPYEEPGLHCWIRQKRGSSAEVDYVISVGEKVVPVEVKAGRTGSLKSIHLFLREKGRDFGLRFNADVPSLLDAETSLA
ncbi:MAG: ATP-binding protein, partial [Planctomycetes bacterium]|nr:ATP-binding protein [Planctomycetota bacterium]